MASAPIDPSGSGPIWTPMARTAMDLDGLVFFGLLWLDPYGPLWLRPLFATCVVVNLALCGVLALGSFVGTQLGRPSFRADFLLQFFVTLHDTILTVRVHLCLALLNGFVIDLRK